MTISDLAPKSAWQRWKERIETKTIEWLPENQIARGMRSPHFWIVAALLALLALVYYAGYTPLAHVGGFLTNDFPHDIHRALFLFPIIYAAVTFRSWGALGALFILLCVVLPRPFLGSPYSAPILRPLLFFLSATFIGLLTARLMDRVEEAEKAYANLKESQEQLLHAEKLTSLGQLAASVAHEVNNPIAGVLLYTQLLTKKLTGDTLPKEKVLEYLAKMESELTRSSRIIGNLLDFARQKKPALKSVNINDVIDQVLSLVGHSAQMQRVEVVRNLSPDLPLLMADPDQLQQVCTNLMLNAIQAMPEGGTLTLRTAVDGEDQVKTEVQDTGCGISRENMQKLFTPFFSTKKEVKGVGLGLAVAHGIIQSHHGRIEVQSKEGQGSTFTIYLPVHHE